MVMKIVPIDSLGVFAWVCDKRNLLKTFPLVFMAKKSHLMAACKILFLKPKNDSQHGFSKIHLFLDLRACSHFDMSYDHVNHTNRCPRCFYIRWKQKKCFQKHLFLFLGQKTHFMACVIMLYQLCLDRLFPKILFSSFSELVATLRRRMVMKIVLIDSLDVLA